MKISHILALLLATFATANIFADQYIDNTHNKAYYLDNLCDFSGTINTNFEMLLEQNTPNFYAMANIITVIAMAKVDDLKNPNCAIKQYAEKYLEFYNKHKDEINKNHSDLAKLSETIQKKLLEQ